MHFDGSKMLAGLGAGVVLTSPIGDTVRYVLKILYTDSNNAAEYQALLHGLQMAVSMGIQCLEVRGDSNLAISQINGEFDAKDPKMAAYRNVVLKISARFEGSSFIMWPEGVIKQRTSLLAWVLSAIPSHPIPLWRGSLRHPLYGRTRTATPVRIRSYPRIPNTIPISSWARPPK
ncbi:hypothetical protein VPH35_038121 [Triticum aestivum]